VLNWLEPFFRSGVSHPNVQTLNTFAVNSGLSGFKRGLGSGSAQNSVPKHSRVNATTPRPPMPHRNVRSGGLEMDRHA